jgi:sorting nexin-29
LFPITEEEVEKGVAKLNNGKAAGKDQVKAELYKYGGKEIITRLTLIYNRIFEKHQHLDALGEGLLATLNKPNKKGKKIDNTRPITLLNTVRKILSNVLLKRISDKIINNISISQSGFRKGRSTSDLVWTYRWIMATVTKYKETIHIMGLDLSKAFDCINREKLLENLKEILDPSEIRITQYLLAHTNLQAKAKGVFGHTFNTITGVPQGDALSPILFIFYLDRCTREFKIERGYGDNIYKSITHYADDTDFINKDINELNAHLFMLPTVCEEWDLKLNSNKTEFIEFSRENIKNLTNRKLGSKLSDEEDIKSRISEAMRGFNTYWRLWGNRHEIETSTKIRLYNACIVPILLYNLSCLGCAEYKLAKLNAIHRKHLKRILGIFYPDNIDNATLYMLSNSEPLSIQITENRWQLLGHILRSDVNAPANKAMEYYFNNIIDRQLYRGRTPSTIPNIINSEIKLVSTTQKFENATNLKEFRIIAQDREAWKRIKDAVVKEKRKIIYKEILRKTEMRKRNRTYSAIIIGEVGGHQKRIRLTLRQPENEDLMEVDEEEEV